MSPVDGHALAFLVLSSPLVFAAGFLVKGLRLLVAPGVGVDVDGMAVMAEAVDEGAWHRSWSL
jgi:hypothetical protein